MSNQQPQSTHSKPSTAVQEKSLSFQGSLHYLKDESLLELFEDVECIESFLHKLEQTVSPSGKNWKKVLQRVKKLKDATSNEFYERTQLYKSEIEELQKEKS